MSAPGADMTEPHYPSMDQINASVRLKEQSRKLGERATRNDTPHAKLDRLAAIGFECVKYRSAWQTGPAPAAIVLGARAQIILSSRADSVETRLASCALAALVARARRECLQKAVA